MRKIYLFLTLCCVVVYANSLSGIFFSDDIVLITNNPNIASFAQNWYYLPGLLNTLIFKTAGLTPEPYHILNLILHIINTLLVFVFLRLFFGKTASLWGAVLFAIHPVNTEAVNWITTKAYLLTCFFTLIPYLIYHKISQRFNWLWYLLALTMFAYWIKDSWGLYFVFPFLLVISDMYFGRVKKNWLKWLPFFLVLLLLVIVIKNRIVNQIFALNVSSGKSLFFFQKYWWLNGIYSLNLNTILLLWPIKLGFYHEPIIITLEQSQKYLGNLIGFMVILPFIATMFSFKLFKKGLFLLGFYLLFLAPTLTPVRVSALIAERYLYIPSIALGMLLALLYELSQEKKYIKTFVFFACLYLVFCGVRTIIRNNDYKTQERFWKSAVWVSPKSHRAHNNLGVAYVDRGNYKDAIKEFKTALYYNPKYQIALDNLVNLIQKKKGRKIKKVEFDQKNNTWHFEYHPISDDKWEQLREIKSGELEDDGR